MTSLLVPNWKEIAVKSLTMRFVAIGTIAELILEFGIGLDLPWWAHPTLLFFIGGGRLIQQNIGKTTEETDDDAPLGI